MKKPCNLSAVASNDEYVFVAAGTGNNANIQVYEINTDTWKLVESVLKTPRYGSSAVIINDKLHVFAGYGTAVLDSVEVFDVSKGEVHPCSDELVVPALKEGRYLHTSVVKDVDLVIHLGGHSGAAYLSSCESINVTTSQRCDIADLLHPRGYFPPSLLGEQILVTGGYSSSGSLSNVESYSFLTKQWSEIKPLTTARYGHCSCAFDKKLFVFGGYGVNTIVFYDPTTLCWRDHDNLHISRAYFSTIKL